MKINEQKQNSETQNKLSDLVTYKFYRKENVKCDQVFLKHIVKNLLSTCFGSEYLLRIDKKRYL